MTWILGKPSTSTMPLVLVDFLAFIIHGQGTMWLCVTATSDDGHGPSSFCVWLVCRCLCMTNGFYVSATLNIGIWMCIFPCCVKWVCFDWFYVCDSREATIYQGMADIVGSNKVLMHCFDNV